MRTLAYAALLLLGLSLLQALSPAGAQGQGLGLTGSYLNVWTRVGNSLLGPASGSGFHRLRVMRAGDLGFARLDLAYEHTLSLREPGALGAQFFTAAAGTASGGDWLTLGGDLGAVDGVRWRHRFDRLSVRFDLGDNADLVIGRQPVSWAATLFLTPSDPFSPFDPADPFREYRMGVDAARLRYYRGAFTQFEVVARAARVGLGGERTLTLLGRATTNRGGWDLGVWGGLVHDTFGAAASASGSVGLWALRAEAAVRDFGEGTGLAARGTVGLDRTFDVAGRSLYVVIEYQRDEAGAASSEDLGAVAISRAFAQGEMQVLGRDTGALQLSWQVHPLASASALILRSLRDGSIMFGPGLSHSVTQDASFRIGAYTGVGEGAVVDGGGLRFGSEYGTIPWFVFVSMNFFFEV